MTDNISDLYDEVIEQAANRDQRLAENQGERERRLETIDTERQVLLAQLAELDEAVEQVNTAYFAVNARIADEFPANLNREPF